MNWFERRRFLNPRHCGIVLSPKYRLSAADSFKNLVLVAPTGAGKTTRYVIPNVLLVEGSVVVTDPAGEIYAATEKHLRQRGFGIQVLQPTRLEHSLLFNPLAYWQSPQQLRALAEILARSTAGAASDPFWSTAATNVLYLGLSALANVEDEQRVNLANLRWILNQLGLGEKAEIHAFMSRYLEHHDPRIFAEYLAFIATDDRVQGSILSTARTAVELWADPQVCQFTATNTVDIAALRQKRTVIYLIVPEHQVRYFGVLMNLFYSACFGYCLENSGDDLEPVYFFLDEFGNMGHIANFASIITTLRKRRCSISIILQDLSQLEAVYGRHEARTIFSGGCANKLFFAGLDVDTATYVERVLGRNTAYDNTFGGISEHARTLSVPLMSADQVRMLKWEEAILIAGRERPVRVSMTPIRPAHLHATQDVIACGASSQICIQRVE